MRASSKQAFQSPFRRKNKLDCPPCDPVDAKKTHNNPLRLVTLKTPPVRLGRTNQFTLTRAVINGVDK